MNVLQQLNAELAGVVTRVAPYLVRVANGRSSGGAGVIWGADGLIISNAHVVQPSLRRRRTPTVILPDGRQAAAEVVAYSREYDLAALQVEGPRLTGAAVGDSAALKPGDWLTAIGHPWGVIGAVTSGALITVDRPIEVAYPGDMLQVGLHMRPGHSGGPMVNDRGEVVGINCMIAGPDVGLAIPSETVRAFLRQQRQEQSRPTGPLRTL